MKRLYFPILISLALVFGDHVVTRGVAGFDTFAYVFPKFLYFVDALGSGHWPFWDPFHNAGDYFLASGLMPLSPYFLPFAALAQVLHPLLAFELSIVGAVLIGLIATLRIIKLHRLDDLWFTLFIAITYALIMKPLLGQLPFLFSSVFFFVTYASLLAIGTATRTTWSFAIAGIGCSIVAIAGYPHLNACVSLLLLYGLVEPLRNARATPELWRRAVRQLAAFSLPFLAITFASIVPLLENSAEYYQWFWGDLRSPDLFVRYFPPKLDELHVQFRTLGAAALALIDSDLLSPRDQAPLMGLRTGLGFGVVAILGASFLSLRRGLGWIAFVLLFLILSLGTASSFWPLVSKIPVFNNIRYHVAALVPASLALLILVTRLSAMKSRSTGRVSKAAFAVAIFGIALTYSTDRHIQPWSTVAGEIAIRKVEPLFEGNLQKIVSPPEQDDQGRNRRFSTDGILKKTPILESYNLLNHPGVSRLKRSAGLTEIFYFAKQVEQRPELDRANFSSDNDLLEHTAREVEAITLKRSAFTHEPVAVASGSGEIRSVKVSPGAYEVSVHSETAGFLTGMFKYFPGWTVAVDDRPAVPLRTNYFFNGVRLEPGEHRVRFEFKPRWLWLIALPYVGAIVWPPGFLATPYLFRGRNPQTAEA
ncbi:MAG: hypothetical protein IPJ84_13400 [Bdellovibrionales bacterium]|nr:hypothetical protein [Bdellovibrionales bacterium]